MAIDAISSVGGGWQTLVSAAFGGYPALGLRGLTQASFAEGGEGTRVRGVQPSDPTTDSGAVAPTRARETGRREATPRNDTAYQRNADGDDARLSSLESQLTDEERDKVEKLKQRDAEVRTHEQAHLAQAGAFAQGVSYEYEVGPDGKKYAVGGSVQVDTSPVAGDPAATIAKMQTLRRAALAPDHPSGQDRTVAVQAAKLEAEARAQLAQTQGENQSVSSETRGTDSYERSSVTDSASAYRRSSNETSNQSRLIDVKA